MGRKGLGGPWSPGGRWRQRCGHLPTNRVAWLLWGLLHPANQCSPPWQYFPQANTLTMRYLKGATWYLAKGTVNKFVISPTLQNYPHSKFLCVQSFTSCWLPLTFVRPCLPPWPCFPAVLHMCHLLSQFLNGIRLLLTSGPLHMLLPPLEMLISTPHYHFHSSCRS